MKNENSKSILLRMINKTNLIMDNILKLKTQFHESKPELYMQLVKISFKSETEKNEIENYRNSIIQQMKGSDNKNKLC